MGPLAGSTLDPEAQWGRCMNPQILEGIMHAACPDLVFKRHPDKPHIKNVYRPVAGELIHLFPYEGRTMPEYDIRYAIERWVPDPACNRLDRADLRADRPVSLQDASDLLAKHGVQGAVAELMKRTTNGDKVGYLRVRELGGTAIRGWRSVLSKLVELKLMTVTDAERVAFKYGSSTERSSWAAHLGKQALAVQG